MHAFNVQVFSDILIDYRIREAKAHFLIENWYVYIIKYNDECIIYLVYYVW